MTTVAGVIRCARTSLSLVVLALVLFAAPPLARASLIISVQSVGANSPSSADALDITLTNTGPGSVTLGSFSFGISVTDPAITFTSATIATVIASYVFAGQSLLGPTISTSVPGQTLDASDAAALTFATIAGGATVGLGHVFFDVAAGDTAGPKAVALAASPTTELLDVNGSPIPFSNLNGTITITTTSSGVPQPSTILLVLTGITSLTLARRHRR
jgi:hypothetical protein